MVAFSSSVSAEKKGDTDMHDIKKSIIAVEIKKGQ